MKLLYELETQADELIVERLRRPIAAALPGCKPMRQERDAAMASRHSSERTLIATCGAMRQDVPAFH